MMGEAKGPCKLASALSYAVSEWFLMLLLFIDGLFSYMITRFAKYCHLQTPCLFCSRLDHIFSSKDRGFYKNLICRSHKLEISSLAYCHVHQRLADVCEMCEPCLLSFTTAKKTNSETYRSLVGKLEINYKNEKSIHQRGSEFAETTDAAVPMHNDSAVDFLKRTCSCCKDYFCMTSYSQRLLQIESIVSEVVEPSGTLLGLTEPNHQSESPNLCQTLRLCWKPYSNFHGENHDSDTLSHFGHAKPKVTSESEPEAPTLNGHDGYSIGKKDLVSHSTQTELDSPDNGILLESHPVQVTLEKLVHTPVITTATIVSVQENFSTEIEPFDVVPLALTSFGGHKLGELNGSEVQADDPSTQPGIEPDQCSPEVVNSRNLVIAEVPSTSASALDVESKPLDLMEIISKLGPSMHDQLISPSGVLDLNDMYKLVIRNQGHEASPSPRESSRAQEDLRVLLSQMSFARGLDSPWNDMTPSPRVHGTCEETRSFDGSTSNSLPIIGRKLSIERNESGISSLDGSAFSEIEGECAVDRLKRLVEFEKKSLILLYKELEEERNASAIAANQAMAMITRLQEEKAAMQMEALHYQRMMEEQAEYDHEALQKANDLLSNLENELHDLKFEIATYRGQAVDEYKMDKTSSSIDDFDVKYHTPINQQQGRLSADDDKSYLDIDMDSVNFEQERDKVRKEFLLDFEDEKLYIFSCLKKLEKRLNMFPNAGENDTFPMAVDVKIDDKASGKVGIRMHDLKDSPIGINYLPSQKNCCPGGPNSSFDGENCRNHPLSLSPFNSKKLDEDFMAIDGEIPTGDVEIEISQLSERIKAMEDDLNFIEHAINSLKNGNEGIQFVQEIACHLQELRKSRVRRSMPTT